MSGCTVVIVGKGGTGKTAELIKKSAESGIYILVANRRRAEILAKQAEDMKLYIPFPVTLQEWLRSDNRFHGSSIHRDGLLIDDIDDVIKELFFPIEIKVVTLRTPHNITSLDTPTADVVEVRHGRWLSAYEYAIKLGETNKYRLGIAEHDKIWHFCSLCEQQVRFKRNFCPECGAKMDGERREQ
jgi:hypothetical protein